MSEEKQQKQTTRQIWVSQEIVRGIKMQKINDPRKPRDKPTLNQILVAMFEDGLKSFSKGGHHEHIPRRDTTETGYFVLTFNETPYTAAEKIAEKAGIPVIDVIVWLIGVSHSNGFQISII